MTPWLSDPDVDIYVGDALDVLRGLPDGSVDCCVTSPPYWGLRDYGTGSWTGGNADCDHVRIDAPRKDSTGRDTPDPGTRGDMPSRAFKLQYGDVCGKCGAHRQDRQLGLEATPDLYVAAMVAVFAEVRRVLADHGTLWLNIGDSYAASASGNHDKQRDRPAQDGSFRVPSWEHREQRWGATDKTPAGLKPKDLCGIPWRLAFALQADGWWLRSDIIWSKPNPMPESVTDRPTKAHEYVFLLSKRPSYWFDAEAVREPHNDKQGLERFNGSGGSTPGYQPEHQGWVDGGGFKMRPGGRDYNTAGRNVRSVWEIATQPYPDAHFATFPEELPRRAILAGCPVWVCGVCGKARERLLERKHYGSRADESQDAAVVGFSRNKMGGQKFYDSEYEAPKSVGWSDCGHDAYRPGRVLDPFLGSGTTAHVARKHGRRCVGIELNETYAALAARRLQQLSLLADGGV